VKRLCIFSAVLILLLATVPAAFGQSITSRITGTVADETGGVIAGATVELTYQLTQQVRTTSTGANGRFLFNNVLAGNYNLHIETPGFNSYDQRNLSVAAQETVALGTINLAIGEVTTSIEVQAESLRVETQSSDRTQMMQSVEIESIPLAGRAFSDVIRAMPGVAVRQTRDRAGREGLPAMNGGNTGQFLVTIDGIASQDSGATSTSYISPNVDAIGEVKVVTSSFNAEYGSRAGGQMNVTIKSGQQDFHGTGYYYWRHETLNANEWFNNAEGDQRPIYRFTNPGGTIGGPVLIPGTSFNQSRTKMFFFYSHEQLFNKDPQGINRFKMPTQAERDGDFSNSLTEDDIPLSTIIKDPTTGELFPGGVIPQDRTVPMGRAVLNLFPLPQPGVVDPSGNRRYNAVYQFTTDRPRGDRILRLDFNFGANTTSYLRLLDTGYSWEGYENRLGSASRWDQYESWSKEPSRGLSLTVVRMLSPTIINETTVGVNYTHQQDGASDPEAFAATNELSGFDDPVTGQVVNVPHIFEGADYRHLIPNIQFGTSGAQSNGESLYGDGTLTFGFNNRWPFDGTDDLKSVINNLSWVKGDHNMKFGFYYERMARNVSVYAQQDTAGTYRFGSDLGNPLDTGWPLSNALVGTVQAYGEDSAKFTNPARYNQVEWFVQDAWQATSRLSLDLGIRFQIMQPIFSKGSRLGWFEASAYNRDQTGELLYPTCLDGSVSCKGDISNQGAINLQSGAIYPIERANLFDPASYSNLPFSGIVQYDSQVFETPPVLLSPRFGFAFDVFGTGKTAVRGGIGIFYARPYTVDRIAEPMRSPPLFLSPTFYNTTFDTLRSSQAWYGALTQYGGEKKYNNPTVYNFSFGIQQELFRGTVLDVAYVGNRALHNFNRSEWDYNALPPMLTWTPEGMTWSPETGPVGKGTVNQELLNPTNPGAFLDEDLIRGLVAYNGWGDIPAWTQRAGNSNYNSLQVQLKYRAGNSLSISGNYTWARTMQYTTGAGSQWVPDSVLYQQQAGRRGPGAARHALNMNFNWSLPQSPSSNPFVRGALNNWQLSGVVGAFAGQAIGASCSYQSAPLGYPAGTPTGGIPFRCDQVGPTLLPDGTPPPAGSGITPRVYVPVNEAGFVLPKPEKLGLGNAPVQSFYGPGFFNLDLSIQKNFPIGETTSLEFRMDSFNFLNHFNPSDPATNLRYRYTTGAQTRSGIGEIRGTQNDARKLALSARFRF